MNDASRGPNIPWNHGCLAVHWFVPTQSKRYWEDWCRWTTSETDSLVWDICFQNQIKLWLTNNISRLFPMQPTGTRFPMMLCEPVNEANVRPGVQVGTVPNMNSCEPPENRCLPTNWKIYVTICSHLLGGLSKISTNNPHWCFKGTDREHWSADRRLGRVLSSRSTKTFQNFIP